MQCNQLSVLFSYFLVIYKTIALKYWLCIHSFQVVKLCNLPNVWNLVFYHYLSQAVLLLHLPAMLQNVVSDQVQLLAAPLPLPFQCCFSHPWCISNRTLNPLLVHLTINNKWVSWKNHQSDGYLTLNSCSASSSVFKKRPSRSILYIIQPACKGKGMHSFLLTLLCNILTRANLFVSCICTMKILYLIFCQRYSLSLHFSKIFQWPKCKKFFVLPPRKVQNFNGTNTVLSHLKEVASYLKHGVL